jgi:hypothetical protein
MAIESAAPVAQHPQYLEASMIVNYNRRDSALLSDDDATVVAWTVDAVRSLGITTNIKTAATILGIGRTKAYELARTGNFPIKILRVGRRYLVPVPAILHVLDAD